LSAALYNPASLAGTERVFSNGKARRLVFFLAKELIMAKAIARHILVSTQDQANTLKDQIEQGADFEQLAKQHSQCPSGQQGGSLGEFSQGQMVPEFEQVVFDEQTPIGSVSEPVKTDFGFHLIKVEQRYD
jgi:peptidyl-prolyl cis-trans isomerase C